MFLDGKITTLTVDNYGQAMLITAAAHGHTELVKSLLHRGVPVTLRKDGKNFKSALSVACELGNLELANVLLPYTSTDVINDASCVGSTLLMRIVEQNKRTNKEIVKLLLAAGARTDIRFKSKPGYTVLHAATQINDFEVLKLLLEAKADVNARTDVGITPFWLACGLGLVGSMKLLLQYGTDPKPLNELKGAAEGQTYTDKIYGRFTETKPYLDIAIPFMDINMIKILYVSGALSNKDILYLKQRCEDPELFVLLYYLPRTLRPLQSACRIAVLGAMRQRGPDDVNNLPLPTKLKDYLMFNDLHLDSNPDFIYDSS